MGQPAQISESNFFTGKQNKPPLFRPPHATRFTIKIFDNTRACTHTLLRLLGSPRETSRNIFLLRECVKICSTFQTGICLKILLIIHQFSPHYQCSSKIIQNAKKRNPKLKSRKRDCAKRTRTHRCAHTRTRARTNDDDGDEEKKLATDRWQSDQTNE